MPDSREFPIARYIAEAEQFFDQPPAVVAGALYGQTGSITVDAATALVTAFLGHIPSPPPAPPGGVSYVILRPRGDWSSITAYLVADAVVGSDGSTYYAEKPSTDVNPVGDESGTWVKLVGGAVALAVGAAVAGATDSALLVTNSSGEIESGPATASVASVSSPGWSGSFNMVSLLDPRFGVHGDGTTDDLAAIKAAIEAAGTQTGTTIRVPAFNADGSRRTYRLSSSLHIDRNVVIEAEDGGADGTCPLFVFDAGHHGVVFEGGTTAIGGASYGARIRGINLNPAGPYANKRTITDAATTAGSTALTSATASFTSADVGIALCELSAFAATLAPGTSIASVTNGTTVVLDKEAMVTGTSSLIIGGSCGLVIGSHAYAEDCLLARGGAYNWNGYAVYVCAHQPWANANAFELHRVWASGSDLDGFMVAGGDANAGLLSLCISEYAGGAAFRDDSGLGNTYLMCQTAGSTTNAFLIGSASSGGTVNASVLLGCYTEGGSGTSYYGQYVTVVGGVSMHGSGPGAYLGSRNSAIRAGVDGESLGFFENPPIAQPTITGATADAGAASLWHQLYELGLVANDVVKGAAIAATQESGSAYTFALADDGTVVESTGSSAATFTIPPHSSVAWSRGVQDGVCAAIEVFQDGAGQVTIAAGAGVTLRSDGNKVKTAGQYATIGLRCRATDEWVISGDLA